MVRDQLEGQDGKGAFAFSLSAVFLQNDGRKVPQGRLAGGAQGPGDRDAAEQRNHSFQQALCASFPTTGLPCPDQRQVIVGGGQDAQSVTTTSARQGHFEVRLWHTCVFASSMSGREGVEARTASSSRSWRE